MGLRSLEIFFTLTVRYGWSSESDVYRRQILTTKVYPRAVRLNNMFITRDVEPSIGLPLTTLKCFCINHGEQRVISI